MLNQVIGKQLEEGLNRCSWPENTNFGLDYRLELGNTN